MLNRFFEKFILDRNAISLIKHDLNAQFSGHWYNVASFASDNRTINDCATLEFQEDNLGYTLRETYVDPDLQLGNRTQKTYFARVDPTFDAGNKAKFVVSYESGGKYTKAYVSYMTEISKHP